MYKDSEWDSNGSKFDTEQGRICNTWSSLTTYAFLNQTG